ncbi:hypothetical protein GDO78_023325 [Eleutherodactylus coqui]|uniref:Uncharacterized protein n=1 Tax=Eleutherodactylus coqui TaxID=57060 RepID=A0A8J6EFG2_ELECQ|nr:hypothetical protein GDO78_023325 [Eleutherodactylus coqui]
MEFILTDTRITLWLKPQSRRLETLVCNGTRDPVMAAHEDTSVRRKILCLPSGWRTSPQMMISGPGPAGSRMNIRLFSALDYLVRVGKTLYMCLH